MTDLHPKLNPYFRDPRIRQFLLKHGLINRFGDILRPSASDASLTQPSRRRKSREHRSSDILDQPEDREVRPRTAHRNQTTRPLYQSTSGSLSNTLQPPLPKKDKHSPKRAKSAYYPSNDLENRLARRSAKAKSPEKKKDCRVIMTYIGPQTVIEYDRSRLQQRGDEIIVMQQHCGGENLVVFKGFVRPGEKFAFDSRRHADYPFALALYINGLIDCRVSVCCEYRHRKDVPLVGPAGLFVITAVEHVRPCRSCRYERRRKQSKSTPSLGHGPSRYRKSVVRRSPPKEPSKPLRPRSTSTSPRPSRRSSSAGILPTPIPPIVAQSRTPTPPPEVGEKISPLDRSTTGRSSSLSRTSTPTSEGRKKKSRTSSSTHSSSKTRTKGKSNIQSPPIVQTPSPTTSDADDKRPTTSSIVQSSSAARAIWNEKVRSPSLSEISSSGKEDKSPTIAAIIRDIPIVPTSRGIDSDTSDVSRTPTPPRTPSPPASDADDKKPSTCFSKHRSPTDHSSSIQKTAGSQNNNHNGNYEPDFDQSDDDDHRPSSSRYGKPRISDSDSIDEHDRNQRKSSDDQVKRSPSQTSIKQKNLNEYYRKSSSDISKKSETSEDEGHNRLSQILSGKNNMASHSRRSSTSTVRKSGPSEDEEEQYTLRLLNGRNKIANDTQNSSSRRSNPSPKGNSDQNRFPSITNISKKESEGSRRSSVSSDDFFEIKRSSTREKSKGTQGLSTDWFEPNDRNDQPNLQSSSDTKSRERKLFFDEED